MIKPWDYINEYKKIKSKIIKSIDSSLSSGFLILGPQLDLFEKNFQNLLEQHLDWELEIVLTAIGKKLKTKIR